MLIEQEHCLGQYQYVTFGHSKTLNPHKINNLIINICYIEEIINMNIVKANMSLCFAFVFHSSPAKSLVKNVFVQLNKEMVPTV